MTSLVQPFKKLSDDSKYYGDNSWENYDGMRNVADRIRRRWKLETPPTIEVDYVLPGTMPDLFNPFVLYYIVSTRMRSIIEKFQTRAVQFYPIVLTRRGRPYEGEPYYYCYPEVLDCIDYANSPHRDGPDEDMDEERRWIGGLEKLVLDESKIPADMHIFDVPATNIEMVVSEELGNALKESGCSGFYIRDLPGTGEWVTEEEEEDDFDFSAWAAHEVEQTTPEYTLEFSSGPATLKLVSGSLLVVDPFTDILDEVFPAEFEPCEYILKPILAIEKGADDEDRALVAGLALVTPDTVPLDNWIELNVAGPLGSTGIATDSTYLAFMDAAAREIFVESEYGPGPDTYKLEELLETNWKSSWSHAEIDLGQNNNVFVVSTGHGDGIYPVHAGLDQEDSPWCILFDFQVVEPERLRKFVIGNIN